MSSVNPANANAVEKICRALQEQFGMAAENIAAGNYSMATRTLVGCFRKMKEELLVALVLSPQPATSTNVEEDDDDEDEDEDEEDENPLRR
jgi:hypothetical protein